jgi:hypothetical protein
MPAQHPLRAAPPTRPTRIALAIALATALAACDHDPTAPTAGPAARLGGFRADVLTSPGDVPVPVQRTYLIDGIELTLDSTVGLLTLREPLAPSLAPLRVELDVESLAALGDMLEGSQLGDVNLAQTYRPPPPDEPPPLEMYKAADPAAVPGARGTRTPQRRRPRADAHAAALAAAAAANAAEERERARLDAGEAVAVGAGVLVRRPKGPKTTSLPTLAPPASASRAFASPGGPGAAGARRALAGGRIGGSDVVTMSGDQCTDLSQALGAARMSYWHSRMGLAGSIQAIWNAPEWEVEYRPDGSAFVKPEAIQSYFFKMGLRAAEFARHSTQLNFTRVMFNSWGCTTAIVIQMPVGRVLTQEHAYPLRSPMDPIQPKRSQCATFYDRWEISYDGGRSWYAFQSPRNVCFWI